MKNNILYKIPALILCLVILVPCFPASAQETKYYRSGIYTYMILNEQEKQISICEIASQDKKITIPSELDGYQVYALGYESHFQNDYSVIKEIGGGAKETLEELEIPSSVKYVYAFAFSHYEKLKKVSLPGGIYLCRGSFSECSSWKDILLPPNTTCEDGSLPYNLNTLEISSSLPAYDVLNGTIQKLILSEKGDDIWHLGNSWVTVKIKQLFSPENAKKLVFNYAEENSHVEKLYVNGADTAIDAKHIERYGDVTFGDIYTVDQAKAISFARKNKINYHVKQAGKVKKVSSKKKAKTYQHQWKKSKTKVTSYRYNKKTKKWTAHKKTLPTIYNVYGKKTKNGTYKLIASTKFQKIKTNYRYVKIKASKIWETGKENPL